jgi:hypothetical protein
MNKNIVLYLIVSGVTSISMLNAFTTGSPGGKTASPGDGVMSCMQCHQGFALNSGSAEVSISSTELLNGYTPGQTYLIDVSVSGAMTDKIGFEVTAERYLDNAKVGVLGITDALRTQLINSDQAVTHTASGAVASNGGNSWSFEWVAPTTASDSITFYGAFNEANGNQTTTGDRIYTTSFTIGVNPTGIGSVAENLELDVYPILCNEVLMLDTDLKIDGLKVYDMKGTVIIHSTENLNHLDVSGLRSGVYLLQIETEHGMQVRKIIKH